MTGTAWNSGADAQASYTCTPYDRDANTSTFNPAEQAGIVLIWERVAEAFRAFDVDVTTEPPAVFTNQTARVLITQERDAKGVRTPASATASGVPLQLLPKDINGVRIIGIDVPGFGVPTHAEAKDVLAGAMLKYARTEAMAGPVQAPRGGRSDKPTITLLGEMFPVDPVGIGMMLEPMGLAVGPVVPTRECRELYQALDSKVVAAIHPFYTASIREFEAAGRSIIGSAPIGFEGTATWLEQIGKSCNVSSEMIANAQNKFLPANG